MSQACRYLPLDAVLSTLAEEDAGLLLHNLLAVAATHLGILGFVGHIDTGVLILRQHLLGCLGQHFLGSLLPIPIIAYGQGGDSHKGIVRGDGDGRDDGLASFHLREVDDQLSTGHFCFHHLLVSTVVPGLSPDVQVIHHSLAIDSHIEDAQALTVDEGRTRAVPRLNEVQLHTVFAIGHIKLIVQPMTTETERLEEPPVTRTADGVMGRALAGQVGIKSLE